MSKAREILNSVVIPRNELYAIRKREYNTPQNLDNYKPMDNFVSL